MQIRRCCPFSIVKQCINRALYWMLKGMADRIQIFEKINYSRSKNKNCYWVLNLKDEPLMSNPKYHKVKITGAA
jgi:hypothetical protein